MKKYELMVIYPLEDESAKKGAESLKSTLSSFGAEIEEEKPFGDRDLTYEINKLRRGRFILFHIRANPAKISEMDRQFKLNMNLLRYLFVAKDEKEA